MKSELDKHVSKITDAIDGHEISEDQKMAIDALLQDISTIGDNEVKPDIASDDTLLDQATRLEIEFENTHPKLAKTMAEIVRILSDMGV